MSMSLTISTCKHKITEIDGEEVCTQCGSVLGYSVEQSYQEYRSHNIGMFGLSALYNNISKIGKGLNLPYFAIQTIIQTTVKISKFRITKKQAILFSTVYACRTHNIPRLLEDIFFEIEKQSGTKIRKSEKSLLRLLNRISKRILDSEIVISPPNKDYYLHAYLAKIQPHIIEEVGSLYFESMRARVIRDTTTKTDPCSAARETILQNLTSLLKLKLKRIL